MQQDGEARSCEARGHLRPQTDGRGPFICALSFGERLRWRNCPRVAAWIPSYRVTWPRAAAPEWRGKGNRASSLNKISRQHHVTTPALTPVAPTLVLPPTATSIANDLASRDGSVGTEALFGRPSSFRTALARNGRRVFWLPREPRRQTPTPYGQQQSSRGASESIGRPAPRQWAGVRGARRERHHST